MGGRKKQFIDKKKSATFKLFARDSSDTNHDLTPGSDRVFVRVDDNPFNLETLDNNADEGCFDANANSVFSDAPEDGEHEAEDRVFGKTQDVSGRPPSLPTAIRKRILELGFPDDGYNYLTHLREIKNTGCGALFYHNSKARLDELPRDVKIYNASSKTIGIKVQRAVDPEVAALLDEDSDLSRFGSDVEDLGEDFVVQANLQDEHDFVVQANLQDQEEFSDIRTAEKGDSGGAEKPRCCLPLDEEFDFLLREEYEANENDHSSYECEAEDEFLADKLKNGLADHARDDLDCGEIYRTPADVLNDKGNPRTEEVELTSHVIRRCVEYAEGYENEDQNDEIIFEESDESEAWDCDTIVSTYSNLDNHPGKIEVTGTNRKKKLAETVSEAMNSNNHTITLGGKEKLPVDFLPSSKKNTIAKEKGGGGMRTDFHTRNHHGQESKEERKERKSALKEERREARRIKKEMKELYKGQAQRAQKAAAISGPASLRLM